MSDMRELYQEMILDHNRKPRNFRVIEGADHHAEGQNPLCGDQVQVWVKLEDGRISDVAFQGQGCAISKSSASMMTDLVKGKTREEAEELFLRFQELVTVGSEDIESLGRLAVFAGVHAFPSRVKCASLGWHTLHAALKGEEAPISTE
ncbi:MAG: SUF system NifU family Fe-S cluster assembly protein [Euryarchaeota archaeon]|nr:SUF system NifU family Fe-S cluster assembly protein [Euryarchaeota archaeon]